MIYCKSYTDPASAQDGQRVLIGPCISDGLLADTVVADTAAADTVTMDLWLEALAPSSELMQWAAQHPNQPNEFRQSYFKQLSTQTEHWLILLDYARQGNLTLFCASPHQLFYLEILAEFLEDELEKWQEASSPVCYAGLDRLY